MREILLVEDDQNDARLIGRVLEQTGVLNPVRHVSTGREAMQYLKSAEGGGIEAPSIIVLDLKLPDVGEFDILGWVKERDAFAETLVVVLSNLDDLNTIRKAYSLGADSYLAKPGTEVDVKELIRLYSGHWSLADRTRATLS